MKIKPYTLRAANEYVRQHHRHSKVVVGCKFCIAAVDEDGQVIGVAIVGRPVARKLDDGYVGEIVRTCTEGAKNVNSFLYGACARIWKEMGGTKILTYTNLDKNKKTMHSLELLVLDTIMKDWNLCPIKKMNKFSLYRLNKYCAYE